MPPWWLLLGIPIGFSIGLAGLGLMAPEVRWLVGWALTWIGFGSIPVLLLFLWRWKLTYLRVLRRDGSVMYLSRKDAWVIMQSNDPLFKELATLNPDLEERQMMDPEFPPFILRGVTQFWSERQMPIRQRVAQFLQGPKRGR